MNTIIASNARALSKGKTALIIGISNIDSAQIDGVWHAASELADRQPVDAVNHFGRHTSSRGDRLRVQDDDLRAVAVVDVTSIQAVNTADLTDEEVRALGFADRADFAARQSFYAGGRRVWLFNVRFVRPVLFGVI